MAMLQTLQFSSKRTGLLVPAILMSLLLLLLLSPFVSLSPLVVATSWHQQPEKLGSNLFQRPICNNLNVPMKTDNASASSGNTNGIVATTPLGELPCHGPAKDLCKEALVASARRLSERECGDKQLFRDPTAKVGAPFSLATAISRNATIDINIDINYSMGSAAVVDPPEIIQRAVVSELLPYFGMEHLTKLSYDQTMLCMVTMVVVGFIYLSRRTKWTTVFVSNQRRLVVPVILVSLLTPLVSSFVIAPSEVATYQSLITIKLPPTGKQQRLFASTPRPINIEEPDESESNFGRMAYWDESYRQEEDTIDNNKNNDGDGEDTNVFSWYCGWTDELGPFFEELVPDKESLVLVPGIGNDLAIRDMFDFGGYQKIVAFDYAPQGVECAKAMFGTERLDTIANKVGEAVTITTAETTSTLTSRTDVFQVCDARDLSGDYGNDTFDAVLEKGTFDSIYLSGGKDKAKARENLNMAVSEIKRVLKEDGIVFSVTAACVDAVREAFERDDDWEQVRDGSPHITEDGYASNNVDATMLAWKLKTTTTG